MVSGESNFWAKSSPKAKSVQVVITFFCTPFIVVFASLSTAREGNVFRSVCLSTGGSASGGGLPNPPGTDI